MSRAELAVSLARRVGFYAVRIFFLGVVPIVAIVAGLRWYAHGGRYAQTENAYVKANILAVSAQVPGRVIEVEVRDNQAVAAGAPLFRIDPQPFELAVDRARARLDVIRTEVDTLRAQYKETLLDAEETRERILFFERQLERQERLKQYGMTRGDTYDEARLNLQVARRHLASTQESAKRVLVGLNGDAQLPAERYARFIEAKAALDEALVELERTKVTAPAAGVVSNLRLRVGEYAERGTPLFSLIESGQIWIEANYKETQLSNMQVGQTASVVSDIYPDRSWAAVVASIAPATGAEFAVLPPQNATGNWVKVVQRVPVLLHLESSDPSLRAGMTVTVAVDTGRERGLPRSIQHLVDSGWLPRSLQPTPVMAGERN